MNKTNKVVRSTISITLLVFLIKLLGLLKQSVLAACCGATVETDAFFIVTSIIVAFCTIIFSSISVSLLPIYTKRVENYGVQNANLLIMKVLKIYIPISLIISIFIYFASPIISKLIAPSYNLEEHLVIIKYFRILSISFLFWCFFQIINVVLEANGKFLPGKGQGLFQNLFLILSALFLYPYFGIDSLIFAFLFSIIVQCVLVLFSTKGLLLFKYTKEIHSFKEIKQLFYLSIPLMLGNAVYEINDIVDKQIGTSLGDGNVSILTYSASINEIVTGVIVSSISTVLFAHFSTLVAKKNNKDLVTILQNALICLFFLLMPIMIMCIICGRPIVTILYGRGSFGYNEINLTYHVVIGYALGFIFQAWRSILSRVFYAFQDTKTPMINGIITVSINILLNYVLAKLLGISGISYATSISMFISTIMLLRNVKKYLPSYSIKQEFKEMLKSLVASLVTFIIIYIFNLYIPINNVYYLFITNGIICLVMYIILLLILKSKYITLLINLIRKRI